MALEAATYINQLNPENPDGLDPKSQGDDHLRLTKGAIKRTFPNITGEVTPTQAQLNLLASPGTTTSVKGMIMMWFGAKANIPAGWINCDGLNGTPNLQNRFPMGAGATGIIEGVVGGSGTHIHSGTFTTTVAGHALTEAEMPAHTHSVPQFFQPMRGSIADSNAPLSGGPIQTGSTGGNLPHTHGATTTAVVDAASNLPPYVTVWFIMKT